MTEELFFEECKKFLDYFGVDYKGDTVVLTDGGNSCIMNPKSQFAELFGGKSINSVARYVGEKLGKKVIHEMNLEDDYWQG